MKRSRRKKNIEATTSIIKEGVVTTTTVRRTIVEDSMDYTQIVTIANLGINVVTRIVRRMNNA